MAGVGVPVLDTQARAVAALSVGTLAERLNADRLPHVVKILQGEAQALAGKLNPFDVALRYPSRSLSTIGN